MSTPHTRLESVRPSVREDLHYVTELLGQTPEPSTDFRVWNEASQRLQRVAALFGVLNDDPLTQLGKASLEFAHLLASNQFTNPSEACQRLLACLQVLADHNTMISSGHPNTQWQNDLLKALGAQPASPTASTQREKITETHSNHQAAANKHVTAYQAALLNWLTGRDADQSLAQIVHILQRLQADMPDTPLADLADLSVAWRDHLLPIDGHARQCLSRAERLLQQMAAGEDFSQRSNDLQTKLLPLSQQLPPQQNLTLSINVEYVNQSDYWRPHRPAPADRNAWTGLAAALRDELRYVIESLDVATRVAPSQAPDMKVVATRIRGASQVLSAAHLPNWADQLNIIADKVTQGPNRAKCLRLAEQIQDVMACLEPEVIEQLQNPATNHRVSTRDTVAELSRTAVIDAALSSIARLSARFEIIATSDSRPTNLRPTEEIDALWGTARVLNWHSLSDAAAWLRGCAKDYLEGGLEANQHALLGTLLTGCVVVERFLQTVRLPWPDLDHAEAEMLHALQQLAPEQFGPPSA